MTTGPNQRSCNCDDGIVSSEGAIQGARIFFACPRCAGGGDRREAAARAACLTDESTQAAITTRCDLPPDGWVCTRDAGHDGPCAAERAEPDAASLEVRLQEAEAHLWAMVVWFGGRHDHPYIDRDVAAAATYIERHTAGRAMGEIHRHVIAGSAAPSDALAAPSATASAPRGPS